MKLRKLTIRSLPGLHRTIEFEPEPDRACVVLGPNASGKTSLLRALTTLLDPHPDADAVDLEAEFLDGDSRVRGRALGPTRRWLKDGTEVDRPDWPGPDQLSAYLVRADELSAAGQPESAFSAVLRRVMAGGFDIEELAGSTEFSPPPRPRKLAREFADSERAIEALEREQTELAGQIDQLADLRRRRDESIEAGRQLAALEQAQKLLSIERSANALSEALGEFPDEMDSLDGSEGERLQHLEDERARLERDLADNRSDLEAAREAGSAIGIDDVDSAAAFAADVAERRQVLAGHERRLADLGERVAALEDDLRTAVERAGGLSSSADAALTPDRIEALERAADRWNAARSELEQLERSRTRHAEQAPDADALADTDTAARSLRSLLRVPAPTPAGWIVWSLLLTAVAGTAAWLWFGAGLLWPALTAAAGALLPLGQLIVLTARTLKARRIRRHYPAYAMEPPPGWRPAEVGRHLDMLERELSELLRRRADADRARDLGIEAAAARERVETARRALDRTAHGLGLEAGAALDAAGRIQLRALADWRTSGDRLNAARREAAACQRAIDDAQDALAARFDRAGQVPPDSLTAEALGAWQHRFDQRIDKARAARERARAAERSIERIERGLQELRVRRRKLLRQAGVEHTEALAGRMRMHAEFCARRDELRGLEHARSSARGELQGHPELLEQVDSRDQDGLIARREVLESRAAERDRLGERIATIESEHRTALKERRLEALNAERERLRGELERARDARMDAEAAQLLIARARSGHGREHQPKLLRRAGELFGRMTRSRFELNFDGSTFGARDVRGGLNLELAELSTATRIQLLLALRLAWIERTEHGGPDLPLFLDEVLATTDPDRYRAVVEAVQELVREGRQVIYLSSQPADAQAWRRFAGDPEPAIVELIPIADGEFEFVLPPERALPETGLPPAEWARRAGVPALDPWADADSAALFHLLRDDLETLVEMARAGIETVGEFEHARAVGIELRGDAQSIDALARRAGAARAWLQRWRRGHAPPVRDADLQASDAVSETFFEPVSALNRELSGEARALIRALREGRVARFRSGQVDKLEAYLAAKGVLDEREAPTAAERLDTLAGAGGLDTDTARTLDRWLQAALDNGAS